MQHFWGASHDFWQNQWIKVLDLTEGDDYITCVVGKFCHCSIEHAS